MRARSMAARISSACGWVVQAGSSTSSTRWAKHCRRTFRDCRPIGETALVFARPRAEEVDGEDPSRAYHCTRATARPIGHDRTRGRVATVSGELSLVRALGGYRDGSAERGSDPRIERADDDDLHRSLSRDDAEL